MAYIPEEHKIFPVLPYSREHGREVFQYLSWPEEKLKEAVGEHLVPYGYNSYEDYYRRIDELIEAHSDEPETVCLLNQVKQKISEWNRKEEWSICRFIGEDIGEVFGLHQGGYYYWPCSASAPKYGGVIDDEEFTAYQYPTDSDLWEIVVDPTGMAQRTIYGGDGALMRRSQVISDMKQHGALKRREGGEATGLRWCDIDLEEGIFDVNHTLVYYNHRNGDYKKGNYFGVNTPKTKAGKRLVPMLDFVKEAFLMEKANQQEMGVTCNIEFRNVQQCSEMYL